MNEFIDFITSNTTLAYTTAFIIFLITLVLVTKRLIGFMITLLLLLFAILSGLSIANHDLFRDLLQKFKTEETAPKNSDAKTYYKNQFYKAYDELKREFEDQKQKWEAMYEAYKSAPSKDRVEERTSTLREIEEEQLPVDSDELESPQAQ
ncbi:hypothetical protein PHSC3_001399 [Chlamydiales bacterium STE3]|nr:hypothetical protein PHSC3_001399 [Chlamydiales bacterium STE3]